MRTWSGLLSTILLALLGSTIPSRAASPTSNADPILATFRVTTGEVHVALAASSSRNRAVSELTAGDFVLLCDGEPVKRILSFTKQERSFSALVLTDVSESMKPGLPLERAAAQWLETNTDPSRSLLTFRDFGLSVGLPNQHTGTNLTSLYDSLMEALPLVAQQGARRRALILLTDGDDNTSYHVLSDVVAMAQKLDVAVYAITAHPSRKQYVSEDVLNTLTSDTGGRFFQVRKPRELEAALTSIRDELTNGYELVFRPDGAIPGMHQLSVRSLQQDLKFHYRTAYYQPQGALTEVAQR